MKKNILFGFSFMLLLLGLASCEKEFSTQDCEAINSMEINTTKVKDEGDEAIYYAFTPNNAKFLTYDYQWYVDDELQPAATKSLFQYKFTKNGTYTICFEPILKSGDNCELTKTCTSVAVDSLKDTAVKDPCDEIEFSQVVALNGNSSKFATVALQAKGDFQGARTYKWYLNGKELSDDDRKAILDTNVTSSLTVFKFEEAGTYNIKLMVSSKECKGKSLSVEAEVDADLNVKIMDQKEAVEEGAPTEEEEEEGSEEEEEEAKDCTNLEMSVRYTSTNIIIEVDNRSELRKDNATFVWSINGKELTPAELLEFDNNDTDHSLIVAEPSDFNKGKNIVEVKLTSPSLCPGGVTLKAEVFNESEEEQPVIGEPTIPIEEETPIAEPVTPVTPTEGETPVAEPTVPVAPVTPIEEGPSTPVEPKELTCNDISIELGELLDPENRNGKVVQRALYRVTSIKDATYTWFLDGKDVTSELSSAVGVKFFSTLPSIVNMRLEPGTHVVEILVTSPNICPGGVTIKDTIVVP